ncbi:MAG TPA: hypothetical protein PLC59_07765 [Bacteroidales bacterium]|nr:hypothetical protein [Bacteroidales bacterium]
MAYKKEFDIDIIGGQEPLTKEEEEAISTYIKAEKVRRYRVAKLFKKRREKVKQTKIAK